MFGSAPVFRPGTHGLHRILVFAIVTSLSVDANASSDMGSPCLSAPPLPAPVGNVVYVSDMAQLQDAVSPSNLVDDTTILLAPGDYYLNATINISRDNVTLRGATDGCDDAVLIGKGMEDRSVQHGIFTNNKGLKVQNLAIRDVYNHPIALNAQADSPQIYNVKLLNAGQQFIKASSGLGWGQGVDDGIVEYTIMEYTAGPPSVDTGGGIGYTNGVDVHGGQRWNIRNNLFKNFSTPDSADHLWNPAVLMWNGAGETVTENNVFVNVDRAIAYGLKDDINGANHTGGIIRNNMIVYEEGLYSSWRKSNSDGAIILWDSPGTKVLQNTILTNGNLNKSIEFRWNTAGGEAKNNLVDAPISGRSGALFTAEENDFSASAEMFVNPADGDLHLLASASQVPALVEVPFDFDGQARPFGTMTDVGADAFYFPGDFDGDTDIDGNDFLVWQRGGSPKGATASDLGAWETNYGTFASVATSASVPEPSTGHLFLMGIVVASRLSSRRWSQ